MYGSCNAVVSSGSCFLLCSEESFELGKWEVLEHAQHVSCVCLLLISSSLFQLLWVFMCTVSTVKQILKGIKSKLIWNLMLILIFEHRRQFRGILCG